MAKRSKRLKKAIESYKDEIEKHFNKLDKDIEEGGNILARYYIKELDKSLIDALEKKLGLLGEDEETSELLKKYKARLMEYKKKVGEFG
ncbi:MAG: hypothetical protein Q7S27_04925 [Nanoarchaeota archaeon]|nr:hypothetical protein [Nanoarchaeota archaeon]